MVTSHRWLLSLLLLMDAAILILLLGDFDDEPKFTLSVAQILERQATIGDAKVRVRGTLVAGSLCSLAPSPANPKECVYRFVMGPGEWPAVPRGSQASLNRLTVYFRRCGLPIPCSGGGFLQDLAATGRVGPGDTFEAESIMARCGGNYVVGWEPVVPRVPRCAP